MLEGLLSFVIFIIIILVIALLSGIKVVKQQELYLVEFLGKYSRVMRPGLHILVPVLERIAFKLNLRTQNLDFLVTAITKDKVSVSLDTTLIYQILPDEFYSVAYTLQNPTSVIRTSVENDIRAYVATQTHEEILEKRDEISHYLVQSLKEQMLEWGYQIMSFQVKDVVLPKDITEAMSRVVASKRLEEAAANEANAEFIKTVKAAEGQKARRILQGEGLAGERLAIVNGLATSIQELSGVSGTKPETVLNVVLMNQYIDMLSTIGKDESGNTKVVYLNSNPSGMGDAMQQFSEMLSK